EASEQDGLLAARSVPCATGFQPSLKTKLTVYSDNRPELTRGAPAPTATAGQRVRESGRRGLAACDRPGAADSAAIVAGNAGSRPRRATSAIGSSTRPRRAAPAQVRGEHPGPALFAGDVVSAGSLAWSSHDGREPALPGCVSRIVGDGPSCNRARGGPVALPGGCNGCSSVAGQRISSAPGPNGAVLPRPGHPIYPLSPAAIKLGSPGCR